MRIRKTHSNFRGGWGRNRPLPGEEIWTGPAYRRPFFTCGGVLEVHLPRKTTIACGRPKASLNLEREDFWAQPRVFAVAMPPAGVRLPESPSHDSQRLARGNPNLATRNIR